MKRIKCGIFSLEHEALREPRANYCTNRLVAFHFYGQAFPYHYYPTEDRPDARRRQGRVECADV